MKHPMSELRFAITHYGSDAYRALCMLRDDVLRRPIGLRLSDEDIAADADYVHFSAWAGEQAIGCVLLGRQGKLRQMAVHPNWQGKGIGQRLLAMLEEYAQRHGMARIHMHARVEAAGFYERLGYVREGEVFDEVGVPHVVMVKDV
jgi:GNAT superfamily N-acetyltransferase